MDQQSQFFYPERGRGVLLHGLMLVFLVLIMFAALWSTTSWAEGSMFVLFMILIVILTAFIPFVFYRLYALLNARYILERDGLRLRWGLRTEDIPLTDIEWIRRANESGYSIQLPVFSWPGAFLGEKSNISLGSIEFIASDLNKLILIATRHKVYAISPKNPRDFELAFQRTFEMGSLFPIESRSTRPTAFIQQVLKDRFSRYLLPLNVGLTVLLWLVSGFIIANNQQLPLGFSPQGVPLELVGSQQLLLIPILGLFVLVLNVVLGLFFFRQPDFYLIAYLLWSGGVITPFLLVISMIILSFYP
ncbi:MAG: PH domain-containing protein [Anaerolineaceae bacterium]|nr:PH domain-containing protein [Anaerolineaceae bacterium]